MKNPFKKTPSNENLRWMTYGVMVGIVFTSVAFALTAKPMAKKMISIAAQTGYEEGINDMSCIVGVTSKCKRHEGNLQ